MFRLARTLGLPLVLARAQVFDAGAAYAARPGELPEQIVFASPREMILARDVIGASASA